jgi:hypothetical protein
MARLAERADSRERPSRRGRDHPHPRRLTAITAKSGKQSRYLPTTRCCQWLFRWPRDMGFGPGAFLCPRDSVR